MIIDSCKNIIKTKNIFKFFSTVNADLYNEKTKALLEKYQSQKLNYVISKDNYRVDVGLLIDRAPIFLQYTDEEMQWKKYRHQFEEKYNLYFPITKELMDFKEQDPLDAMEKQNMDNISSHQKKNSNGEIIEYSEHSKLYKLSDPNMNNNKSIQYAGAYRVYLLVKQIGNDEWIFPHQPVLEKQSFAEAKQSLMTNISNDQWFIHYNHPDSVVVDKKNMSDLELENDQNKKVKGTKIFYFLASHTRGPVAVNPNIYSEFAWVPRIQLNKFLTREKYNLFVKSLSIY